MTSKWRTYDKLMTSIWQAYGKHMASMWQAYDKHMTIIMVYVRRWLGALFIFLAFRSVRAVPDWGHMEYEAYCKHVTSIWQAYDKHMASIWQAYDEHMASIWQAYDKHNGLHWAFVRSPVHLLGFLVCRVSAWLNAHGIRSILQARDRHMTSKWQAYDMLMTSIWQAHDSIWQAYDKHNTSR